ncbi:helix-turn-helix transcriptional regulator [Galbibacter sp. EGI 63066]|uniref:helix-turn-helix domain-containing protein n=1 Tax=Galbibacter sp. EGI 63066 TaxID=2993559 RepID=UPI0022498A14|nr:helix-turn-helix transcriptional regulator [Galbibacter sp. EGI 63066]MCX2681902.1 helix-turn-helix transcriptional regulator [Galbibacter sp. EGI 63066]
MTKTYLKPERPHIGRNIRTLRNLKGIKQEALAAETGISQSEISEIENSENIEDELLYKIAEVLNLTPEVIKTFDETYAFYSIDNKLENVKIYKDGYGIHQVFSPIEKVVELYERLLASEKEKVEILKNSKQ